MVSRKCETKLNIENNVTKRERKNELIYNERFTPKNMLKTKNQQ